MKKNLMNLFMLCALTAPLYLGSCAPKAENKQVCENEEKTEKNELEKKEIIFNVKSGKDGRTFGTISTKQISEKLKLIRLIHISSSKL